VLNDAPVSSGGERKPCPVLKLFHASKHNLKNLSVEIPLRRFVCVTGVSGSGKTTLVREVLLPALERKLSAGVPAGQDFDRFPTEHTDDPEENGDSAADVLPMQLLGTEFLGAVTLVDQSILGKTPRSNPAVYVGAFDDIREFFAQSEPAVQRGLNASAFSFNSGQGQCERCRGAGFEKIEMQFLSDVFIRCPECNGRRYRPHILEIKVSPRATMGRGSRVEGRGSKNQSPGAGDPPFAPRTSPPATQNKGRASGPLSIADMLESTVEEAAEFLAGFSESRPATRALVGLRLLQEVGLGYLKLGQPINTLSGGESQRLKLVRHLAASDVGTVPTTPEVFGTSRITEYGIRNTEHATSRSTLFLFDEPTTGLHFDDVRVVLKVFQRLVDAGHSVLVIEHNLDVIKTADWIVDLGPDGGEYGGRVVATGTPEQISRVKKSHTGQALIKVLHAKGELIA
jgi:excinuclease ABC subunit A